MVSTVQDSANAVNVNTFEKRKMLKMFSVTLHILRLFPKLGTALFIGPVENFPTSSQERLLIIQKLFGALDEDFKIAACVVPRHDISLVFKFRELLDGHCILFNHLQTVVVQALLSDTCKTEIVCSGNSHSHLNNILSSFKNSYKYVLDYEGVASSL